MTNHRSIKAAVAAILWTLALSLGISGSETYDVRLMFWGGIAALVACLVTSQIVMEAVVRSERLRVEDILEGLIEAAERRAGVPKIGRD